LPETERVGSIEIEQDLDFQRRSWTVQRVSWVVMLMIAVAGLLGVFGGGVVAHATVGDRNELSVDYERLVRMSGSEKLGISFGERAPRSGSTVSLWLDRGWLSRHKIRSIVPEPESTSVAGNRVTYHFSVKPGAPPSKVEFDLETMGFGSMHGKAGIPGGRTVTFSQFSYP
jgi:hypothetical protein